MMLESIQVLATVFGSVCLLTLVAYLIGRAASHLLLIRYDSVIEEAPFSVAAGLGVIALLVFLLGIAGLLVKTVVFPMLGMLSIGAYFLIEPSQRVLPRLSAISKVRWYIFLLVALLILPIALLALYPPLQPDAIAFHLPVAKQYATLGTISPTYQYRYVVFPQLVDMLATISLMWTNALLAQSLNLVFLAITALAITGYVHRLGYTTSCWWAGAILLSSSAVLVLVKGPIVDLGLTAFVTLAFLSFENWHETSDEGWLVFSGLMAAFAAGTRYTGILFMIILCFITIIASVRQRTPRHVFALLLPAVVVALPWYLYNAYHTGNPVWPYFPTLFGHKYWSDADLYGHTQTLLQSTGKGKSLEALVQLPINLFRDVKYFSTAGSLSYSLMAGAVFALVAVFQYSNSRRIASVIVGFVLIWFITAQVLAYLVPVIPLLCAVGAVGMGYLFQWFFPSSPRVRIVAAACITVLLLVPGLQYAVVEESIDGFPPLTRDAREEYLESHLPPYGAIQYLRRHVRTPYRLYSYGDARLAFYAEGGFRGDQYGPWRYGRITPFLEADEDTLLGELQEMGITHLLVREEPGNSECDPVWLERHHVVPVYRIPGYVLFDVRKEPWAATLTPEEQIDSVGAGDPLVTTGLRIPVEGDALYYVTCVGNSINDFAQGALQITWYDAKNVRLRSDEVTGTFLPQPDTLRLLSTSPPNAVSAQLSCARIGKQPFDLASCSVATLH